MIKRVLFTAALLLCLLPAGCGHSENAGFPTPEEILSMNQAEAEEALQGRPREDILSAWGEPDGSLSGLFGDIYRLEDSSIILYYNVGTAGADGDPEHPLVYAVGFAATDS